jgi:hypothetical protein
MAKRRDQESAEHLLIDLAAAAEVLSAEELRHWAVEQRVFISSVMDELRQERRNVAEAIRAVGAEPVWFEEFGARDADPYDAYIGEVAASTIYVGLLGSRYGRLLPTRYSATHTEYSHAEEQGLRINVYPLEVSDREGRQQAFLDEIWQFHTAPMVSADGLTDAVTRRLGRIAAEDLSPWCKLGSLVFRASRIVEASGKIVVTAKVRSRDVAHALDELQNERWHRTNLALTSDRASQLVNISEIATTTTASTARIYQLSLERQDRQRDPMMDMSFGGKSTDEVTEVAMRAALFGEPNPFAGSAMSFVSEIDDPLRSIRGQRVPDEILRPLVRLLLTEALIDSGRAARLVKFRLGPAIAGKRRLELAWEAPRRYSNVRPGIREIKGTTALP